jgi:hypothetical protein
MRNVSKRALVGSVVAVILGLTATGAWLVASASASVGCTDTWNSSSDGDWGTAADWTNLSNAHVVPTASDVACWASGITLTVGSTDPAETAASVQGGSLDITGAANVQGVLSLADSASTSNLDNLTVGSGELEGPGAIALSGSFLFTGLDQSSGTPGSSDRGTIGYPTALAISQTGGGSFTIGQSGCPTSYFDGTYTTSSPVMIGCSYMLPEGGTLVTTSSVTLAPLAYPSAAGSRMTITAEGYDISNSTAPQDFNLIQDGGTTTIPTNDNFTPGVGLVLDSGNLILEGADPQFSEGPGQLSNGLTLNGGTLSGIGQVNGQVTQTGGVVEPGQFGTGNLTLANTYDQEAGGTLQINASGAAAGDYDVLDVTGQAQLAGTLEMTPTSGYAASAAVGDSLDVMQTGYAVTGTFSTVTGDSALVSGDTFSADYATADQVDAVVTAPPTPAPSTSTPTPSTSTPSTSTPTPSTPTPSSTTPSTTTPVSVVGPSGAAAPGPTGSASVQGTPLPGDTLTCDPGTWTGDPTFTYQWARGTSPISGATSRTYTVTILDEGAQVTCAVSARDSAGSTGAVAAGVAVAEPGTLNCPRPDGAFSAQRIGPFSLGETRSRARKSFHDWKVIQSGFDNFCLYGGWGIRGAYKTNRFVFLDTANPYYKLKGVSPGDTVTALAAKLKLGPDIVIGANDWRVATGTSSNYVFKTRKGIVQEIGIANRRDSTGLAAQKRFLAGFKASGD